MKNSSGLSLVVVVTSLMLGACAESKIPHMTGDEYILHSPEEEFRASYAELQEFMLANYRTPGMAMAKGFVWPTHGPRMIYGCGYTLASGLSIRDVPRGTVHDLGGEVFLLFYDSMSATDGQLIGWAYAYEYEPGAPPRFAGVADDAWFVHEAGWHMIDGDMLLTPPAEDYPGERRADTMPDSWPLGALAWHGRAWDLHLWVNPYGDDFMDGAPVASIYEPFGRLPDDLLPLDDGAFFYPGSPPSDPESSSFDSGGASSGSEESASGFAPTRTGPAPGWSPATGPGGIRKGGSR